MFEKLLFLIILLLTIPGGLIAKDDEDKNQRKKVRHTTKRGGANHRQRMIEHFKMQGVDLEAMSTSERVRFLEDRKHKRIEEKLKEAMRECNSIAKGESSKEQGQLSFLFEDGSDTKNPDEVEAKRQECIQMAKRDIQIDEADHCNASKHDKSATIYSHNLYQMLKTKAQSASENVSNFLGLPHDSACLKYYKGDGNTCNEYLGSPIMSQEGEASQILGNLGSAFLQNPEVMLTARGDDKFCNGCFEQKYKFDQGMYKPNKSQISAEQKKLKTDPDSSTFPEYSKMDDSWEAIKQDGKLKLTEHLVENTIRQELLKMSVVMEQYAHVQALTPNFGNIIGFDCSKFQKIEDLVVSKCSSQDNSLMKSRFRKVFKSLGMDESTIGNTSADNPWGLANGLSYIRRQVGHTQDAPDMSCDKVLRSDYIIKEYSKKKLTTLPILAKVLAAMTKSKSVKDMLTELKNPANDPVQVFQDTFENLMLDEEENPLTDLVYNKDGSLFKNDSEHESIAALFPQLTRGTELTPNDVRDLVTRMSFEIRELAKISPNVFIFLNSPEARAKMAESPKSLLNTLGSQSTDYEVFKEFSNRCEESYQKIAEVACTEPGDLSNFASPDIELAATDMIKEVEDDNQKKVFAALSLASLNCEASSKSGRVEERKYQELDAVYDYESAQSDFMRKHKNHVWPSYNVDPASGEKTAKSEEEIQLHRKNLLDINAKGPALCDKDATELAKWKNYCDVYQTTHYCSEYRSWLIKEDVVKKYTSYPPAETYYNPPASVMASLKENYSAGLSAHTSSPRYTEKKFLFGDPKMTDLVRSPASIQNSTPNNPQVSASSGTSEPSRQTTIVSDEEANYLKRVDGPNQARYADSESSDAPYAVPKYESLNTAPSFGVAPLAPESSTVKAEEAINSGPKQDSFFAPVNNSPQDEVVKKDLLQKIAKAQAITPDYESMSVDELKKVYDALNAKNGGDSNEVKKQKEYFEKELAQLRNERKQFEEERRAFEEMRASSQSDKGSFTATRAVAGNPTGNPVDGAASTGANSGNPLAGRPTSLSNPSQNIADSEIPKDGKTQTQGGNTELGSANLAARHKNVSKFFRDNQAVEVSNLGQYIEILKQNDLIYRPDYIDIEESNGKKVVKVKRNDGSYITIPISDIKDSKIIAQIKEIEKLREVEKKAAEEQRSVASVLDDLIKQAQAKEEKSKERISTYEALLDTLDE